MSDTFKVVVMGPAAVGKSSVCIYFMMKQFLDDYDPTIEDSYRRQWQVDGRQYVLDIIDTAGQEEYSSLRQSYMKSADAFVFVYSITKKTTLEELVTMVKETQQARESKEFPSVWVANKSDLEEDRQVKTSEGWKVVNEYQSVLIETSAKTGENIDEVFNQVVRQIRKFRNQTGNYPKKKSVCIVL